VLRKDVPYVTVSELQTGVGGCSFEMADAANLLILSAGGFGHVPLPLLLSHKPPMALEGPSVETRRFLVAMLKSPSASHSEFRANVSKVARHQARMLGVNVDFQSA